MKKVLKIIIFAIICVYFIATLINQQRILDLYANSRQVLEEKIEEEQEYSEELATTKENINSNEYVEQIARRELGMYYPNETIYIGK